VDLPEGSVENNLETLTSVELVLTGTDTGGESTWSLPVLARSPNSTTIVTSKGLVIVGGFTRVLYNGPTATVPA